MAKYPGVIFLLLSFSLQAQKIEILKKSDSVFNAIPAKGEFLLIDSLPVNSEIRFVATIRASMRKSNMVFDDLGQMSSEIEKKAKELGANSYFVSDYMLNDSSNKVGLVLDVYRSSAPILPTKPNEELNNVLYLFPVFTGYGKRSITFRFNKEKIRLGYREYFVCHLEAGDEVKLAKSFAERRISVFGGMPCLALIYMPFNPFLNETGKFSEVQQDIVQFYFRTFFIHPKTCTGCTIPPAASPCISCPQ
jgi:hypothetical protein